jgi:hypothetical protein
VPRSRHLPVAVVDGSLTKNLNEIRVRLWTGPSLDQYGEIGGRDLLEPGAHRADRQTRADERRGAVGTVRRAAERPAAVGPLELEQQAGHLPGGGEHAPRPLVGRPQRIEDRLDPGARVR